MARTEFLPSAHRTKRQITPRGSWSTITTVLSSTETRRARSQDTWRATRCVRQLNSGYEKADQRVITNLAQNLLSVSSLSLELRPVGEAFGRRVEEPKQAA